ncbi:hypothetical protein CB0940_01190 [Cercospora beticola]|uniref:Uncharacterized protein n=1 Tax=Cercospora beticola TaxID=122368 RepID=A0A2G5IAW0_CERBT|nr:hypothetical protein CB0940_01190 [Cercospora beticola]PIB01890.1 hypothetical protein CB0940_01190 [Cercospora beticola]
MACRVVHSARERYGPRIEFGRPRPTSRLSKFGKSRNIAVLMEAAEVDESSMVSRRAMNGQNCHLPCIAGLFDTQAKQFLDASSSLRPVDEEFHNVCNRQLSTELVLFTELFTVQGMISAVAQGIDVQGKVRRCVNLARVALAPVGPRAR